MIDAKLEGQEAFPTTESVDSDTEVLDLLAALERSVKRHQDPPERKSAAKSA